MPLELITLKDLHQFRNEFFSELKSLLIHHERSHRLLKSKDVCKMLEMSPGKLQGLRNNGTLRYDKLGSTIYYAYNDVAKVRRKLLGYTS